MANRTKRAQRSAPDPATPATAQRARNSDADRQSSAPPTATSTVRVRLVSVATASPNRRRTRTLQNSKNATVVLTRKIASDHPVRAEKRLLPRSLFGLMLADPGGGQISVLKVLHQHFHMTFFPEKSGIRRNSFNVAMTLATDQFTLCFRINGTRRRQPRTGDISWRSTTASAVITRNYGSRINGLQQS